MTAVKGYVRGNVVVAEDFIAPEFGKIEDLADVKNQLVYLNELLDSKMDFYFGE